MKLNEIIFTAMDIPTESKKILNQLKFFSGMTEGEVKAYNLGVADALRATKTILNQDEHIVVHVKGQDIATEIDLDELIEIVEEKEGY